MAGARLRPRAELEHLTQKNKHDDDRRWLEVDGHFAHHPERVGKHVRRERRGDAVAIGGADAKRDQREHVQVAVDDRCPAAHEERPSAPHHDRRREREQNRVQPAVRHHAMQRLAGQHLRQHERENRRGQQRRPAEPPRHVLELGIPRLDHDGAWLERHAADRAGARHITHDLRDASGRSTRSSRRALRQRARAPSRTSDRRRAPAAGPRDPSGRCSRVPCRPRSRVPMTGRRERRLGSRGTDLHSSDCRSSRSGRGARQNPRHRQARSSSRKQGRALRQASSQPVTCSTHHHHADGHRRHSRIRS